MNVVDHVRTFLARLHASNVSDRELGEKVRELMMARNRKGWPGYTLRSLMGVQSFLDDLADHMQLEMDPSIAALSSIEGEQKDGAHVNTLSTTACGND